MKTIQLEVQDAVYQTVIDFLALLPQDLCRLIDDNDLSDIEKLENQELNEIADARLNDGQAFISVSL